VRGDIERFLQRVAGSGESVLNDDFVIDKAKTVCFSGHRPSKLPFGGEESNFVNKMLKSLLYKEITDSVDEGYNCFITGLSRGVDLWAGEIVLELKAKKTNVFLVAVYPYRSFTDNYKGFEKWVCGNIAAKADALFYISETYGEQCMKERNYFMVENSSKLIAVLSDYRSGTGQTVRHAEKLGIAVKIFNINAVSEMSDTYGNIQ
jgi:uncharacterized phage-like protein YoqJ